MTTLTVVSDFDVLKDGGACSCPRGPRLPIEQLPSEGVKETFRHGVVITVGSATHWQSAGEPPAIPDNRGPHIELRDPNDATSLFQDGAEPVPSAKPPHSSRPRANVIAHPTTIRLPGSNRTARNN